MAKLCPLFSGSSGNSIYIGHSGVGILVDAGRSAKQLEKSLLDNNLDIEKIRAIFVTHEHTDHISGLRVFASRYGIKVYSSSGTIKALFNMGIINGKIPYEIIDAKGIEIDCMKVTPFRTSHDCSEGMGYVISLSNGTKVGVCTDLGYISDDVYSKLCECNAVVIESNHDIRMLQNGKYPYYLKRRILSDKGHLSNEACAKILPDLVKRGLTRIVLSHLSSENNIPELAYETALSALHSKGMRLDRDFTLNIAPKINNGNCTILF